MHVRKAKGSSHAARRLVRATVIKSFIGTFPIRLFQGDLTFGSSAAIAGPMLPTEDRPPLMPDDPEADSPLATQSRRISLLLDMSAFRMHLMSFERLK